MVKQFKVIEIRADESIRDEALGTKEKFWLEKDGVRFLFKEARSNTGEDWSEKLAGEIAGLIGISAAKVELSICDGKRGTLSQSFIDLSIGEDLIHGNEILAGQVLGYNPSQKFGQSDHTLDNIYSAISEIFSEDSDKSDILKQLASYMVLDALIGNVDRHHENWGLVGRPETGQQGKFLVYVAPTYDHASCLGRELLDSRIDRLLSEPEGVEKYIAKGKGAIYISSEDKHGANPLRLVEFGSRRFPEFFSEAIDNLKSTDLSDMLNLADRIPSDRISSSATTFVKQFLTYTYNKICNLKT